MSAPRTSHPSRGKRLTLFGMTMRPVERRRKIKPAIKRRLVQEAGGKCANPGCPNWQTHIHHIDQWSVYGTHEPERMIAVCPTCHDQIHYGKLQITDEDLLRWKAIGRERSPEAFLYVEPAASEVLLLTGSIALQSVATDWTIFHLSDRNRLRLRVVAGEHLQVSARIKAQDGRDVLKVDENHVRIQHRGVILDSRPGLIRATAPATPEFVSPMVIEQMRQVEPDFAAGGRVSVFELSVVQPGVVRVQGIWPEGGAVIVITSNSLSVCGRKLEQRVSVMGAGQASVLRYTGEVRRATLLTLFEGVPWVRESAGR